MNILFFLRYDQSQASSRVRGFYVAEELRRRGFNCKVLYGCSKRVYLNFLLKLMDYSVVYFQKRYSKIDIELNRFARLVGKKTIFDIDDAPTGANLRPEAGGQAVVMMKNSSAVVVGSHELVDFAQNFNSHVYFIPSSINLNYYKPQKRTKNYDRITLGWIGNGILYKSDLLMLVRPLEKIGEKYNIKLTLIGALGQQEIYQGFRGMTHAEVKIIDSVDWANPVGSPSAISNFDIGLYPLLNNEYNSYKCGFKALEYMAMKVPPVASPVGENKILIENGEDGFLTSNEKEWEESLLYLVKDRDLRKRMGEAGRRKVEESYSLEVCASKLIEVFEKIEKQY